MNKRFISLRDVLRDLMLEFFIALVGGFATAVFSGNLYFGALLFAFILFVITWYLISIKYKRLFKLIKSGTTGYYYSFDIAENPDIWAETKDSFCYLGISANTILELFKRWSDRSPSINEYRFLLMKPNSKALKMQIAYEKGLDLRELEDLSYIDPRRLKEIDEAVSKESRLIENIIDILENGTSPGKQGKLKVRLYDEFIPWWMYILDDKKIYLGILPKGERGIESPVVVMKKNVQFISPFDAFKNNFDRMWIDAIKVSEFAGDNLHTREQVN